MVPYCLPQHVELKNTHEEADVLIIVQQAVYPGNWERQNICVVADDTDNFTLLLHYHKVQNFTCNTFMIATSPWRTSVDIKATVKKHPNIMNDILAGHVLLGCDTVHCLCGVGKDTVIKGLKTGKKPNKLVQIHEPLDDVVAECTSFIACCYGEPKKADMPSLGYKIWHYHQRNRLSKNMWAGHIFKNVYGEVLLLVIRLI